jgi:hypothetical protein
MLCDILGYNLMMPRFLVAIQVSAHGTILAQDIQLLNAVLFRHLQGAA